MAGNEDSNDWEQEASAIIQDIKQHVRNISVANLPSSKKRIYFNLTTLESKDFCVELTAAGFRVIGEKFDSQEKTGKYAVFETPYAMLDNLSPAYRSSFSEELFEKLKRLEGEERRAEDSEDERS